MKRIAVLGALLAAAAIAASAWAAAKPATVRLTQEGVTLELALDSGAKLAIASKAISLKPGTYNVKALRLLKPDDKGRMWEMRIEGDLGKSSLNNVTVDEGQDKVIEDVEPLVFHVATWQWPADVKKVKTVLIRVELCGRHSESYYPGALLKGEKPPTPAWRIKDEQGKVIGGGRVTGKGPVYQFDWVVPAGFTGKFTFELEPVMGPFQWKMISSGNVVE